MPVTCAVSGCSNTYRKSKSCGISFHLFPKDDSDSIRQQWIEFCGRDRAFNPKTWRICSCHFEEKDYERNLQAELLNYTPKVRKLRAGVIPSLSQKPFVVPSCSSPAEPMEIETGIVPFFEEDENVAELKSTILQLKSQLLKKNNQIVILKKKIKILKTVNRKTASTSCKCSSFLPKLLTPAQIRKLKGSKKVKWASEDITRAFTLRYLSKRSYVYLRDFLNYPLPGISTLQKWASKMDMQQGLLETVLKFLKIAGTRMSEIERLIVLQYDEMKVVETYEYDPKHDRVIGPHSQLQVVNVRSLIGKWKTPIFVDFDQRITPEILHRIVNELYGVGFKVVACVSDCGSTNVSLWRELGVSYEHPFIIHQTAGSNIYFFADAPHLLKLIRNWLLDSEFFYNGTCINKNILVELISSNTSEVSSCFKLSMNHLTVERAKRQNVRMAAELLSHTTATALRHYYPNNKTAAATATFIELVKHSCFSTQKYNLQNGPALKPVKH